MVRDNGDAPTGHAAEGSTPGSRSKDLGLDPTAQLCDAPTGHAAEGSTPGSRSKDLGQDPTNYFFDALMVIGFGGPEGLNEVIPFLERVTAGRGIPRDRLAEVGEHYITFGGVSPVNAQNRTLTEELTKRLEDMGIKTPVV
ncbi:MAG: ferrochelatase, partial [Propionibacteriaceae bacterium]|nr:ferrochelatase [Propionibacteriaceae bacterium]